MSDSPPTVTSTSSASTPAQLAPSSPPSPVSLSASVSTATGIGLLVATGASGGLMFLAYRLVAEHATTAATVLGVLSILPVCLAVMPLPTMEVVRAVAPRLPWGSGK